MMGRYRRRVFDVDAVQYTGREHDGHWPHVPDGLADFLREHNSFRSGLWGKYDAAGFLWIWVAKHMAWECLPEGGWVIAEPDGRGVYPCTEDEFPLRYEPVTEDA